MTGAATRNQTATTPTPAGRTVPASITSAGALARLALRRDRIRLPLWLLGTVGLLTATTAGITALYTTEAAVARNAAVRASSIVTRAFTGPATGSGPGALAMSEALVFTCVLAALLNIMTVVRHTRQNEELGRTELARSAAVGRHADLAAALLVSGAANLGVLLLGTAGLLANGLPTAGSLAAAAAVAGVGAAFAGITAVCAQLAQGARGAIGLACAALGLAYLLRAAGDAFGEVTPSGPTVNPAWPSWLSPIGWAQQVRPFGGNDWWPLALLAICAAATVAVAGWLSVHRDTGGGMMPVRRGRTRARAALRGPFALVWRLQRGSLLGWLAAITVFGAVFGGIGNKIKDMFGSERSSEVIRQMGGVDNLVDAYFAAVLGLFAVVITGYTVQALLRLRTDETGGPAEAVLAGAVSRTRWLAAYTVSAVAGTTLLLAALGISTGLAYGLVVGDVSGAVANLLTATLAQLAPVLVLTGVVLAAFGLAPRLVAPLSWAALAVCLVIGQFGALLGLPQAIRNISPFTHLPSLPAESLTATPVLVMLMVAAVLLTVGGVAFHRRNLAL